MESIPNFLFIDASVGGTETTVFDPRHQHTESDGRQNIET